MTNREPIKSEDYRGYKIITFYTFKAEYFNHSHGVVYLFTYIYDEDSPGIPVSFSIGLGEMLKQPFSYLWKGEKAWEKKIDKHLTKLHKKARERIDLTLKVKWIQEDLLVRLKDLIEEDK